MSAWKDWLDGREEAPEEFAAQVGALRAFVEADEPGEVELAADVPPRAVEALVDVLVQAGKARHLAVLAETLKVKALRKAARRGLHKLRARGIEAAPTPDRRSAPALGVAPVAEPAPPSGFLPVTHDDHVVVWVGSTSVRGRASLLELIATPGGGADCHVEDFHYYPGIAKRHIRRILSQRFGALPDPLRTERDLALRLALYCLAQHRDAGRALPAQWEEAQRDLPGELILPDEGSPHPVWDLAHDLEPVVDEHAQRATLETLGAVVDAWRLPHDMLHELEMKLGEIPDSQVIVHTGQVRDYVATLVNQVVDGRMTPSVRGGYAFRFETLALSSLLRGKRDEAAALLGLARTVRDESVHPSDHVALRYLILERIDIEKIVDRVTKACEEKGMPSGPDGSGSGTPDAGAESGPEPDEGEPLIIKP